MKKNKLLLMIGEGLGNIVQTLFLISNLEKYFNCKVDIFITKQNFSVIDIFDRSRRNVFLSLNRFDSRQYFGKIETLWGNLGSLNQRDKSILAAIPTLNKRNLISDFKDYPDQISEFRMNYKILLDLGMKEEEIDLSCQEFIDYFNSTLTDLGSFDVVLANTAKDFSSFWGTKRWDQWEELAKLLNQNKYKICSIGNNQEYIKGTVDKTDYSLLQTIHVILKSKLVVTNESGIFHLANLLKKKNLVLWTFTSLEKNYDSLFHRYTTILKKECIKRQRCQFDGLFKKCQKECRNIPVEDVVDQTERIFAERRTLICLQTFNGVERLEKSLASLTETKNKSDFDVFLLDDGSVRLEMIAEIAKKFSLKFFESRKKRSTCIGEVKTDLLQRVLKLKDKYQYFYFTDDDYEYTDGWLDRSIDLLNKEQDYGVVTAFCHPKDYQNYKSTEKGSIYFPKSTIGGSILIRSEDALKIYQEKKDFLKSLKGLWDFNFTKAIFQFGKKVVSFTYSLVQHNPWEIEGYFHRPSIKGLNYNKSKKEIIVSIVLLCHNQLDMTKKAIRSIQDNSIIPYELIVVNNDSDEEQFDSIKDSLRESDLLISTRSNLSFSAANNLGARLAKGKYLLFLNNDIEVRTKNWLKLMIDEFKRDSKTGIVGPLISENRVDESKGKFVWVGDTNNTQAKWSYVNGYCLMIRKELFQKLSGFDEKFVPIYCEDSDLSFRVKKRGFTIKRARVKVLHLKNKTVNKTFKQRDLIIAKNATYLYQKHIRDHFSQYWDILLKNNIYIFTCREDLEFLLKLVNQLPNQSTILEIGTAQCGTTIPMALIKPTSVIISIDAYKQHRHVDFKAFHTNLRRINKLNLENIILLYGYSKDFVNDINRPLDLLWVDGDHQYNSVKLDITLWGQDKLKKGGIICGHDYDHASGGVQKAVNELVHPPIFTHFELSPNGHIWYATKLL